MTLTRPKPPFGTGAVPAEPQPAWFRAFARRARLIWRVALTAAVTLPAIAIQAVLLLLPGAGKRVFARLYWAALCRVLGLRRNVIGTELRPTGGADGRPTLFVSNHTSWLDILALGGTLHACFVAKSEVGTWPLIGLIAKLGRTVFVSRRASDTGRERDEMTRRLADGDGLILFPEGTSSDGARTLPFRSPFFAVAEGRGGGPVPIIQPVSIVYDRIDGLPIGRAGRPVASWYGDMDLGRHFADLARHRSLRATVVLHRPIDPASFPSRKALAQSVWHVVADGAALLRQNRPATKYATPVSLDSTTPDNATISAR